MGWRAYIETDDFTISILREQFRGPELHVDAEDGGLFVTGTRFAGCTAALEAHERAHVIARELTAVCRMIDSSCAPVRYLSSVRDDSVVAGTTQFAEARMAAHSRLMGGGPPAPIYPNVMACAGHDGAYAEALRWMGSPEPLDASAVYKVFELLRESAGGTEGFLKRVGWTRSTLSSFTGTLNTPGALGDGARHAIGQQPPKKPLSLNECILLIADAVRKWPTGG